MLQHFWKQPKAIVGGAGLLLFLTFLLFPSPFPSGEETDMDSFLLAEHEEKLVAPTEQTEEEPFVMVDVKGEVKNPGVYELRRDERVLDAIQMAGGMLEEAEGNAVNLAERLYDEMVIYVPKKGEEWDGVIAGNGNQQEEKVDINRASQSELETLPGIGPAKAEAIIRYREEHGFFQAPEDLMQVSGIGEKSFEQLQDLVIVR